MIDLRSAQGLRIVLQLSSRGEKLEVRVVESPVGESAASEIVLQRIEDVLRMVSQPTFHEDVGKGLFRSLLPGALRELYRAAFTQATSAGQPLTVELRFDRDLVRVARYPWELLHDGTRFLLQTGAVNLVRYMTFPEPPRPLTSSRPLELLIVAAHPKDQPPLGSEFEALKQALDPLVRAEQLDLAYLLPPTWDSLMDWMLAGAPSILHFEGHGAFTQTGLLVFENADGESDPVDAATLAGAFYGTDLRLAVLSACESARVAGDSLSGSVAPSLILAGIPAVVAMQQNLPDDAAIRFSRGFYQALLGGQDLETAVAAGRKQLIRTTLWHVPTLYLRTQKAGEITRAYLERRIDTAGPRSAPVHVPLRFGLWIRRPDAPTPSDEELRRLLGLEPQEAVSRESTRAPLHFPVEANQIRPGTVEVRLIAPNCDIHTAAIKTMTVLTDFDTPPLWFPLTPRRAGRLDVTFELSQQGSVVASVAHTVRITEGQEAPPVASVHSHGAAEPPPAQKPEAESQPLPGLRLSGPRIARKREEPEPPPAPKPEAESQQPPGLRLSGPRIAQKREESGPPPTPNKAESQPSPDFELQTSGARRSQKADESEPPPVPKTETKPQPPSTDEWGYAELVQSTRPAESEREAAPPPVPAQPSGQPEAAPPPPVPDDRPTGLSTLPPDARGSEHPLLEDPGMTRADHTSAPRERRGTKAHPSANAPDHPVMPAEKQVILGDQPLDSGLLRGEKLARQTAYKSGANRLPLLIGLLLIGVTIAALVIFLLAR